jgi:hypothetical protein
MQANTYSKLSAAAVLGVSVLFAASPVLATAQTLSSYNYYPSANVSTYYVLPGQAITFSGRNYAPGDTVTIMAPGGTGHMDIAAPGGNFSNAGYYVIPFSFEDSRQTFTLISAQSGQTIPITVVVGTFYPNLNPSSYYVARGSTGQASVTGFAPGELVELMVNGKVVATANADGAGNATMNYSVPTFGNTFFLSAEGRASHTQSSRTVTLMYQP